MTSNSGGSGGDGAAGLQGAVDGGTAINLGGGGAGGGGVGFIRTLPITGALISPLAIAP